MQSLQARKEATQHELKQGIGEQLAQAHADRCGAKTLTLPQETHLESHIPRTLRRLAADPPVHAQSLEARHEAARHKAERGAAAQLAQARAQTTAAQARAHANTSRLKAEVCGAPLA